MKELLVDYHLVSPVASQFVVVFIGLRIVLSPVVVIRRKMIIIWKRLERS